MYKKMYFFPHNPKGTPAPCFYHDYNENHPNLIDGALTKMQAKNDKECDNPQPECQRRKTMRMNSTAAQVQAR